MSALSDRQPAVLRILDLLIGILLVLAVAGTVLAFGGIVGWARVGLVGIALLAALLTVIRMAVDGRLQVIRSPLIGLGALLLALAFVQVLPLPPRVVNVLVAASARAASAQPHTSHAGVRQSISVARPATAFILAQWICYFTLALVAAHFVTTERRTALLCGAAAAGLGLAALAGVVQLAAGSSGMYGTWSTGGSTDGIGPSLGDLLRGPVRLEMEPAAIPVPPELSGRPDPDQGMTWFLPRLVADAALGGLASGHWFLTYAVIGLPLGLGLCLHLTQGDQGGVPWFHVLLYSGPGNLALILGFLLLVAGFMTGLVAGWVLLAPLLLGLVVVVLCSAPVAHLRPAALAFGGLVLLALLGGRLGASQGSPLGAADPAASPVNSAAAGVDWPVWRAAVRIFADYRVLGCGFGSFSSVYPLHKTTTPIVTTADSLPLSLAAEGGLAAVALLGAMTLYVLVQVPGGLARAGLEGRALAAGLLGMVTSFLLFSAIHWSIEVPAVAVAASVGGGMVIRWLAGGSDLLIGSA